MDLMKLMMSDWKVDLVNDSVNDFTVLFKGPPDSECHVGRACASWKPVCLKQGNMARRAAGVAPGAEHAADQLLAPRHAPHMQSENVVHSSPP